MKSVEEAHKHFVIAGAQRCGTTYLYHLLAAHPQILMSTPVYPEPKFFLRSDAVDLGADFYRRSFFPRHKEYRILGEKSTSYFECPEAARRLKACLPGARIVVLLRDPVERAVSHYCFTKKFGLERRGLKEVFERLVDREPGPEAAHCSVSPYRYLGRGRYLEDLVVYDRVFGRENMAILVLENLIKSKDILSGLYQYLGADPVFLPDSWSMRFNETEDAEKVALSAETRKRLARYYREANDLLAARYALDLSAWS